jgi:hypothetical protein
LSRIPGHVTSWCQKKYPYTSHWCQKWDNTLHWCQEWDSTLQYLLQQNFIYKKIFIVLNTLNNLVVYLYFCTFECNSYSTTHSILLSNTISSNGHTYVMKRKTLKNILGKLLHAYYYSIFYFYLAYIIKKYMHIYLIQKKKSLNNLLLKKDTCLCEVGGKNLFPLSGIRTRIKYSRFMWFYSLW